MTFIGTATTLLRLGDLTVLTDPNFLHAGERAYVGLGLSTRRLTEPAIQLEELPHVDLVVLSHHHGDHFDRRAAEGLRKDIPIVTEPHSAAKLRSQGFTNVHELRTWETQPFRLEGTALNVTAVPGKHAPQPLGALLPSVMGSIVDVEQGDERLRIYITGDTLYHDRLTEIPQRFPDVDVCLLHLGGTRVAGILLTMNAEQGVRTLELIQPRTAVPIHLDDYTLFKDPPERFRQMAAEAVAAGTLRSSIRHVERGETIDLSMSTIR